MRFFIFFFQASSQRFWCDRLMLNISFGTIIITVSSRYQFCAPTDYHREHKKHKHTNTIHTHTPHKNPTEKKKKKMIAER